MARFLRLCGVVATIVATLLVSFGPVYAQSGDSTPPPEDGPSIPLTLGETTSGNLAPGEGITYTFDVPAGQDVVVTYDSTLVVMPSSCTIVTPVSSGEGETTCSSGGGGGGDGPVSYLNLFPGSDDAGVQLTIELSLNRPESLEGMASFELTASPVAPQSMTWDDMEVTPQDDQPYQVLTFDAALDAPFTVEIEDGADDGSFLWVAYQQPYRSPAWTPSETHLPIPLALDDASGGEDATGLTEMWLYYLGAETFRLLVGATEPYVVHAVTMPEYDLVEGETVTVTMSYRAPLALVRLGADEDTSVALDAQVTEGLGAVLAAYNADTPFGNFAMLGVDASGTTMPLAGTLDTTAGPDGTVVSVQVPYDFTRDEVTVELSWP